MEAPSTSFRFQLLMVKAPFCHPAKRSIDSHTNGLNSGDKASVVSGDGGLETASV